MGQGEGGHTMVKDSGTNTSPCLFGVITLHRREGVGVDRTPRIGGYFGGLKDTSMTGIGDHQGCRGTQEGQAGIVLHAGQEVWPVK